MNQFDEFFYNSLKKRAKKGIERNLKSIYLNNLFQIQYKNKKYINFASNDYLGLSQDLRIKSKSQEWVKRFGAGSGASRLITGNAAYYKDLEKELADFLGTEAALIFPSGWQTNVGVVASLIENFPKPVWVFTDKLNHASLHYGCKAGQVKQIRFYHNDLIHLQERLDRFANEKGTKIILTETLFSMDGDMIDLEHLRKIANYHKAFLFLDDAHATGVYGNKGQGLAPAYADLTMGTFSKAWGSFGAYVAGSRLLCQWLINFCSAFIHTTALPPTVIGSIKAALDIMPDLNNLRVKLQNNILKVRNQLTLLGFNCGNTNSQIIPIIIGSAENAYLCSKILRDHNIWIMPICPPTVIPKSSRLRLTLSAAHDDDEIGLLLNSFNSLKKIIQNEKV